MKCRIVHALQKYLLNPPITLLLALGLAPPGYRSSTIGRKTASRAALQSATDVSAASSGSWPNTVGRQDTSATSRVIVGCGSSFAMGCGRAGIRGRRMCCPRMIRASVNADLLVSCLEALRTPLVAASAEKSDSLVFGDGRPGLRNHRKFNGALRCDRRDGSSLSAAGG